MSIIDRILQKDFSAEERKKLADSGVAMPDGSYPIPDKASLKDAIASFGRAKNKDAVKAHIIKRAKALGATSLLPESWTVKQDGVFDPSYNCPNCGASLQVGVKNPAMYKGQPVPQDESSLTRVRPHLRKKPVRQSFIAQVNEMKRVVTAVVQTPDVPTTPGSMPDVELIYPQDVVQQMAWDFLMDLRNTAVGVLHQECDLESGQVIEPQGENAVVVESYIAPVDFTLPNGRMIAQGSWVQSYKITNDAVWGAILSGHIGAPSLATTDYELEDV